MKPYRMRLRTRVRLWLRWAGSIPALGRARAVLEIVASLMACWAMLASTPIARIFTGARADLAAEPFLDEGVHEVAIAESPCVAVDLEPVTTTVALGLSLRPDLARAVTVVSSQAGRGAARRRRRIVLQADAERSLAAVGVPLPGPTASEDARKKALLEGVAALSSRLGSEEAALAATMVDLVHVEYALDRARAAGVDAPWEYRAFRSFLPADLRDRVDPFLHRTLALATAFSMRSPLDSISPNWVSSPYGWRSDPRDNDRRLHRGVDIAVPNGTPLLAAAGGVVARSGRDWSKGRFVEIDHGHGLTTSYLHASEVFVRTGQAVSKGQVIAKSGSTGRSTGPHLHFELHFGDSPVDPESFIADLDSRRYKARMARLATGPTTELAGTGTTAILVRIGPVSCVQVPEGDPAQETSAAR